MAVFQSCKEKARLRSVAGWRLLKQKESLTFGHAFHAGIAAYFNALAGFHFDTVSAKWSKLEHSVSPTLTTKAAFLRDLKIESNELPITLESE